jgi:hypothetical protein
MTVGQSQTPKEPSKGFLKAPKNWLKKTFSSRSTSPQPSAFEQENINRGGELSSVQHAIVSSGRQWIDPVIGASAALSQQGIFMRRCLLDRALIPASRSSHSGSVIEIATILLEFRPTWICSGSRFETLKAYGIVKLMGAHRSTQHPDSGWRCLSQSCSTLWYSYSKFIAQSGCILTA